MLKKHTNSNRNRNSFSNTILIRPTWRRAGEEGNGLSLLQNRLKNGIRNYFIPIHTPLVKKNYNNIKITGMEKVLRILHTRILHTSMAFTSRLLQQLFNFQTRGCKGIRIIHVTLHTVINWISMNFAICNFPIKKMYSKQDVGWIARGLVRAGGKIFLSSPQNSEQLWTFSPDTNWPWAKAER